MSRLNANLKRNNQRNQWSHRSQNRSCQLWRRYHLLGSKWQKVPVSSIYCTTACSSTRSATQSSSLITYVIRRQRPTKSSSIARSSICPFQTLSLQSSWTTFLSQGWIIERLWRNSKLWVISLVNKSLSWTMRWFSTSRRGFFHTVCKRIQSARRPTST